MNLNFNPLTIKGDKGKAWEKVRAYLVAAVEGKCQVCGKEPRTLAVHHVNHCGLDNRISNLVVLCHQCHGLANVV